MFQKIKIYAVYIIFLKIKMYVIYIMFEKIKFTCYFLQKKRSVHMKI